ncbi:MAG: response regulator [Kofleriaceae bacterium]
MAASRRILLVDDSELTLAVAAEVLQNAGYDVRTSTDVHRLRTVLGGWRPDIILTDVNMPGMSGVELCRLLKSSYEMADVPIVLFSGLPSEYLEDLARDCEAEGFLNKRSLERLPAAVAQVIEAAVF